MPKVVEAQIVDGRFLQELLPGALELGEAMARALALLAVVEDEGAFDVARDERGGNGNAQMCQLRAHYLGGAIQQ